MNRRSIILFDGVCNLCNGAIQFVIKRDTKNQFVFASLQSEEAKKILAGHNFRLHKMESFFLVENGNVYDRSTAALKVLRKLNGLCKLLYAFIIIPKFIRDAAYDFIARNRYRWFGRKDECMIPTKELRAKFLNS
jgi:predicted DCC family thiol-disulfide oxidoreductase YuxK